MTFAPTLRPPRARILITALLAASGALPAGERDVIVSEIHYNPLSGNPLDEFIELHNRGPTAVDVSRWAFTEGISAVLAPGTVLEPGAFLVLSPDPARARSILGIPVVHDIPFTGRLDSDGEIVALRSASGELITRLHYADEGIWPSRPDGSGPTLEARDPRAPPDVDRSWGASRNISGTPGRPNSRWTGGDAPGARVLRAASDIWRYRRGTVEPAQPVGAWASRTFSDGSWTTAPGGFGYGDLGFSTLLDDMQGSYRTVYIRADFDLTAQEVADVGSGLKNLSLRVGYDDGYVAYVNGQEVRRANAGTPGTPLPFDASADGSGGGQAIIDIHGATLFSGRNVVAVQGLNSGLLSGDFLIEAEVTLADVAASGGAAEFPVELNELEPARPGNMGSIELYNESIAGVALPSHALIDSLGNRYTIPSQTIVPGLGRLSISGAQLGWPVAPGPATYVLVEEDGESGDDLFVTSLEMPSTPQGRSYGRYPDGNDDTYVLDTPTPGSPNQHTRSDAIVVNEIHFHPPFVAPGGGCAADCSDARQWIEIHNRSGGAVSLGGWTLSKAVDFTFPAISIPSGGYLVVASSRTAFLATHPGFDSAKVLGDWLRDLAHDTDTINLNDALGNRVDHVKYSDGKPLNDHEPEDEIDDRTFAGSTWPSTADGTGRTIELVNPGLDNRLGAAWAAGPPGGTPGAANASFAASPQGCVDEVDHDPGVPLPSDPVTVTCRVGAVQAVDSVEVLWHREGGGASGTVPLLDDGLSGDGRALNGVYGGTIPPQPEGAIIGFQIRLRLADGKVTLVPRSPAVAPHGNFEGPYFLYQVLSAPPLPNSSADYFVVMRPDDANELASRPVESNVLLPCTFIEVEPDGSSNVKHLAGIRYRGGATRNEARKPYRVAFPSENAFRDIKRLNLNSFRAENEMLVSDLFRRAGLPYTQTWMVNLTFLGNADPGYARKERMDGDFTTRFFGGAGDSGSFYRALDPDDSFPFQGDLEYRGEDLDDYIPYYEKRRDTENPDYSDIIELCRAFDPDETPDSEFPDRIEELIDPVEWARYFALQSLISNDDGSIQTGTGEDYLLYRVPATSNRPDAGKWLLVPWDIEESFSDSEEQLFRPSLAAVRRFLLHPRFTPLYYEGLTVFRNGVFSRQEMRRSYPLIEFLVGAAQVDALDAYVRERSAFVEAEFPLEISAGSLGAQGELVIAPGEPWRYWKGTAAPAGTGLAWTGRTYAETGWLTGVTGIGYGDGDDATVLLDMEDSYTSIYARKTFEVASPASADSMRVEIVYDDGFVLYLNGFEIARRNVSGAPNVPVPVDGTADEGREPGNPETIDLTGSLGRLVNGTNVFSFHILNQTVESSDLSFIPELTITGLSGGGAGCGLIYASGTSLRLQGTAHAYLTRSVLVNGELADWDPTSSTWTATVTLAIGENAFLVESYPAEDGLGAPFASETVIVRRIDRNPATVQGNLPAGVTRWTAAAGPYLLESRVTVPAGARLEIGAGTVVLCDDDADILVRGEIQALGTAGSPVVFLPAACSAPWRGIAIEATGTGAAAVTHLLQNARMEAARGAAGAGAISVTGAKVRVEGCVIQGAGPALTADQSVVTLLDSSFSVASGMSDVIRITGAGQVRSVIERCRLEAGPDDGISLAQASADLRENFVAGMAAAGISISGDGPLGGIMLQGNIVHGCGAGVLVSGGARVTGDHSTIAGNDTGLLLERRGGSPEGGHVDLHSVIVWSNTEDVSVDAASSAAFTFSDVGGGVRPGSGNISEHPRFIDFLQPHYGLRSSSPCIGAGMDGTDMGALPFEGAASQFVRMDADGSGTVNVTDAIRVLDFLFRSGTPPACMDAADSNDDGGVDISDPISVLFYLFRGGITPPAPFPAPGLDPTADGLGC